MIRYDNRRTFGPLALALVMALALTACEHADPLADEEPPPSGDDVKFSTIQTTVFNTSCALSGCHTGTFPPQGLDLSEGQAYANLVNVNSQEEPTLKRIEPGDPDKSYLFLKITGAPGIRGGRMPLGRDPLSDAQIDLIRQWIEEGAQEN